MSCHSKVTFSRIGNALWPKAAPENGIWAAEISLDKGDITILPTCTLYSCLIVSRQQKLYFVQLTCDQLEITIFHHVFSC